MKNIKNTNSWRIFVILFISVLFSGCGEMLDDPTIDKETGDNITLLLVDFNFFTTRANFKFVDVADNSPITMPAKMWFTGTHANDIVDFTGSKNDDYATSLGQMELTFDPNLSVSANSPLEFAVHVEIDGYQAFSQGIQINSEGNKTFELLLAKEDSDDTTLTGEEDDDSFVFFVSTTNTKSATSSEEYEIKHKVLKSDLLKCKDYNGESIFNNLEEMMAAYNSDKEHFLVVTMQKTTDYPLVLDRLNHNGTKKLVSFKKLETGTLKSFSLGGRRVADLNEAVITQIASYVGEPESDIFGFANFVGDCWEIYGNTIDHSSLNFTYTLASALLAPLCETGCAIKFSSNALSSFSIVGDFYNSKGQKIKSETFKGGFPTSFNLENVPQESAKIVFRNNNPSFKPIADLNIENLCSGSYEVDVEAADGYEEYQVVLIVTCRDNSEIAVAPTYSGYIRINGSNDEWQGVDMKGGKVNLLAKPNQEYQIKLQWQGEWEYATFHTKFDANGNYQNNTDSKVSSEKMEDGRTRIRIEHEFEQDICSSL